MKILVVHNPNAGHDELSREALTSMLQRAGHDVSWFERGEGSLAGVLREAFDTVVVAGGDGSVGAVGRELAGRETPIAILPAGTANNLASVLGATVGNLLSRLTDGRVVPFDVGVMDGSAGRRLFLEGVGRGAFADTVAFFELIRHERRVNGREDELAGDLVALSNSVLTSAPADIRLELDGEELAGEFLMVEVTNAGVIGPNLRLSPDALPFDGLFDVILVRASEREQLLKMIGDTATAGAAAELPVHRASTVRFRAPAGEVLHIDGEMLVHEATVDLRIAIQPGALRFYVPSDMKWGRGDVTVRRAG